MKMNQVFKLLAIFALSITMIGCSGNTSSDGSKTAGASKETDIKSTPKTVNDENLSQGVYIIGQDLDQGSYDFKYVASASKDDYWSNDYLWILNSGSEGSSETLGGTKYDNRSGGWDYESAAAGQSVHYSLKNGDQLTVDGNYGNWTYTGPEKLYSTTDSGDIYQGVYTVGKDLASGAYDFKYTAGVNEDDYWSNDYLWILNSGSEGSGETLGGTRYDYRFGSWIYQGAAVGEVLHVRLNDGDQVTIDGEYGTWTYNGPTKIYEPITGGNLYQGAYTVGQDLTAGAYDLTYTPVVSESDYWSNDYIWILHQGSEGSNETLGGTKYDYRCGSFQYSIAVNGAKVHIDLVDGDRVTVDGSFGSWSY